MPRIIISILTTATLFLSQQVIAWNALGHMVIASVAYQKLKPPAKNKVEQLILAFQKEYPEITSFVQMAPWPDSIRGQKIDMFTRWHYIDLAFSDDGTPLKNLVDTDNAVWALSKLKTPIANDYTKSIERARFLAFFVHIVGDLHQPLHTVSRITANLPNGDQGGNLMSVVYKNRSTKLHKVWDGGVGAFEGANTQADAVEKATRLMALYPVSFFNGKASDLRPENWTDEGMENARHYVYNTPPDKPLTQAYLQNAQVLSEQQAVLAGYRLAGLLNHMFS